MAHIGDKIRELREKKGISRPDFCGDESELSVRQLLRIENGESNPNIEKIQFIADKLQVPTYQLMLDYYELPARYKELKYLILRQPVYGERKPLEQKVGYLEEIFTEFYEELPDEEREVVECLHSSVQVVLNKDFNSGLSLVKKVIPILDNKNYFTLNDLLFIRLFALCFSRNEAGIDSMPTGYLLCLENYVKILLKQYDFFEPESLFVYSNCLLTILNVYDSISDYSNFKEITSVLKLIEAKTQDFQKKPLLIMLEWKLALFVMNDFVLASEKYQEAKLIAQALNLSPVLVGLDDEWKHDLERFYQG